MKLIKRFKGINLYEVLPKIYFLSFKNSYDMCMTFLRYQEHYESPSNKFKGKSFKILDFMNWYSNKYGDGLFTYTKDWGGFNIPSYVFEKLYKLGISDWNEYDSLMKEVYKICSSKDKKFYLVGAVGKRGSLAHEVAHGLFYTVPSYRNKMTKLVKEMPEVKREQLQNILLKIGYTKKVFIDEIQAYLSTGLTKSFKKVRVERLRKPFIIELMSHFDLEKYYNMR